jgi:hypothetical protein
MQGAMNSNLVPVEFHLRPVFQKDWATTTVCWAKFVAFHNYRGQCLQPNTTDFADSTTDGPDTYKTAYMPRFRNLRRQETDFLRGLCEYDLRAGRGH